ncbi:Alpha-(1-_3)-arabinofuranosyltransferase [Corynebacterium capitovis DSM 44611]|nr:Alpha-(1->3)-arabinofuranosyltransferase [Corynebacterium capitovis DSM 44611]
MCKLWVSPVPLTAVGRTPVHEKVALSVAWPLALFVIVHRLVALAWPGSLTDDFTTVWSAARRFVERVPVYNETYHYVDPHYLYNPGATLLLSPFGFLGDVSIARVIFVGLNAIAIVLALAWLTRASGFSLRHPVFPLVLALAFLSESVTNTLVFSNINGVLLLALVAFLRLLVTNRGFAAGVVAGLAIVVKPMFAPLLVLPAMRLQWKVLLGGIGVPLALNIGAWPLTPGVGDFRERLLPYLAQTRDYANSSLPGFAVYFGMPAWLSICVFAALAAFVVVAVVVLGRFRYTDPWVWACLSSGVFMAGVCLLSSLGQAYYSMMLFPAVFTVLGTRSPFHQGLPWVGILLCLAPLKWVSTRLPVVGAWADTFLPTAGWALLIITIAAWALAMAIHAGRVPAKSANTTETIVSKETDL